jgi:hypothetical protein
VRLKEDVHHFVKPFFSPFLCFDFNSDWFGLVRVRFINLVLANLMFSPHLIVGVKGFYLPV